LRFRDHAHHDAGVWINEELAVIRHRCLVVVPVGVGLEIASRAAPSRSARPACRRRLEGGNSGLAYIWEAADIHCKVGLFLRHIEGIDSRLLAVDCLPTQPLDISGTLRFLNTFPRLGSGSCNAIILFAPQGVLSLADGIFSAPWSLTTCASVELM